MEKENGRNGVETDIHESIKVVFPNDIFMNELPLYPVLSNTISF